MIARGSVTVPGDKSITHRALMLAAMSAGRCELRLPLRSADTLATSRALRALGVNAGQLGTSIRITGSGLRPFRAAARPINCGNSGTTARLLMGLLAAHLFTTRLTGDRSLRSRPMQRVAGPLVEMGAGIETTRGRLPVRVTGNRLRDYDYSSPVASAQVKTALLFAGLSGGVTVGVTEPFVSRDHTERLLTLLGCDLNRNGTTVRLTPPESLPAFAGAVPGDFSSAAYLLAAGVMADSGSVGVKGVGINPTRTGLLDALQRMGATIEHGEGSTSLGEPVADLLARPAGLRAIETGPADVPRMVDELPLLACIASRAVGTSVFRGVGELRVKESDRLALVARNLQALGARAWSEGDTLWVEGSERPPRGPVETAGDHRLAMSFAVLGTVRGAAVTIDDMDCVAVSYPMFARDLHSVVHAG